MLSVSFYGARLVTCPNAKVHPLIVSLRVVDLKLAFVYGLMTKVPSLLLFDELFQSLDMDNVSATSKNC